MHKMICLMSRLLAVGALARAPGQGLEESADFMVAVRRLCGEAAAGLLTKRLGVGGLVRIP